MKNRKYIIGAIITVIILIYGACVYNTNQKYIRPEMKYYGLDESVECDGYKYTLTDMKAYKLHELANVYDFVPEEIGMTTDEFDKLYFVACVELTKLNENAQYSEAGKYNKYSSSNTLEYYIESYINDGILMNKDIAVGETVTYYYVKSLFEYAFTKETWENLDESDMWLRLYDDTNDCEIYLGTEL